MNCSDMFAFNDFTATRGHSYKLYAKLVALTFAITFFNRVVSVWNRLPVSDSHLKRSNLLNRF